jgi:hypothetical protein
MYFAYKIISFDKTTATMAVEFEGVTPLNYSAPRLEGVYLIGDALENYIQSLHPTVPFTEKLYLSHVFDDEPSTITGGEDIQAKYQAYLDSVI